jgi:predicted CXXCH cytochrome family protein
MKKLTISLAITILIAALSYNFVLADNGPHGGFNSPTTDSCAGCHRAHTAKSSKLLMVSTSNLCQTCHGAAGTGADTDVWDGVYLSRDAVSENPAEGVANRGLLGGGLVNAVMDTGLTGATASAASTSAHTFNGTASILWGNGAVGSGSGSSAALDCGSCHNPHGNSGPGGTPTYRILRPVPLGSNASAGVTLADPTAKVYTISDTTGKYFGQNYGSLETPMSQWCAQCHTRYLAGSGSASTSSGDAIFTYRHQANGSGGVNCIDCHVAHGTSAKMGVNSGAVAWPDGTTAPTGNNRSSLLRIDNRGICIQCHANP